MNIAFLLKLLALVLWALAVVGAKWQPLNPFGLGFLAAGLFCWHLPDLL